MKKINNLLILSLLICGCGGNQPFATDTYKNVPNTKHTYQYQITHVYGASSYGGNTVHSKKFYSNSYSEFSGRVSFINRTDELPTCLVGGAIEVAPGPFVVYDK